MAVVPETKQKKVYKRVVVDAVTALTAALTVSPIVAALDKYVDFTNVVHRQAAD